MSKNQDNQNLDEFGDFVKAGDRNPLEEDLFGENQPKEQSPTLGKRGRSDSLNGNISSPEVLESLQKRKEVQDQAEKLRQNIAGNSRPLAKAFQQAFDEVLNDPSITRKDHGSDLRKEFFDRLNQGNRTENSKLDMRNLYDQMIDINQAYADIKGPKPSLEPILNPEKRKKSSDTVPLATKDKETPLRESDKTKRNTNKNAKSPPATAEKEEKTPAKKKIGIFDKGVRGKNIRSMIKNAVIGLLICAPIIAVATFFPPVALAIPVVLGIYANSARKEIKANIREFDLVTRIENLEKRQKGFEEKSQGQEKAISNEKATSQEKSVEEKPNKEKEPKKVRFAEEEEIIPNVKKPGIITRFFAAIKNLFTGKDQEKLGYGSSIGFPENGETNKGDRDFKSVIKNSNVRVSPTIPKELKSNYFEKLENENESKKNKLGEPKAKPVTISEGIKKAAAILSKPQEKTEANNITEAEREAKIKNADAKGRKWLEERKARLQNPVPPIPAPSSTKVPPSAQSTPTEQGQRPRGR